MTDKTLPNSIDSTLDLLAKADYIADRSLATVLYLALKMGRPLFVEGEAGVGKTEIAKVLDTTGAGDQFAAGFLFGLSRERDLATCARLGAIAAAEVISHYGARPEVPLRELAGRAGLI